MKKLTMWLGCALTALAIGCGDEGTKTPSVAPPTPGKAMDPAKVPGMMKKEAPADPAGADKKDDATEKKDDATEKKDDATEKKDGGAEEK